MAFSQADLNAIAKNAAASGLTATQFLGQAQRETGGSANPDTAASGTGPVGLFQIAPSTYIDPGHGLAGHDVTRAQAIAALSDPETNAAFAAQYDAALTASHGGDQAAAIQQYSGGYYTLDQITTAGQQASATYTQYPLANGAGQAAPSGTNPSPGPTVGGGTGQASAGTALSSLGWSAWAAEIGKRAGVITLGIGIIIICLFWLFADAAIHTYKEVHP